MFPTLSPSAGGSKQAHDINLLNVIESRIMDIIQIEDECKRKLPKIFHQRVPRFMRRRAASHNVKRIPKKLRPTFSKTNAKFGSKSRASLLKYRRRLRFRKHKRILRKHARHSYNDPFKSLLHKWFAKRFKFCDEGSMPHVPFSNNTKNQRNLYRQARYGCAYISYAHLIPIQLTLANPNYDTGLFNEQIKNLNRLTKADPDESSAGFSFSAKSIKYGRYEIVVHLFNKLDNNFEGQLICKTFTSISFHEGHSLLTIWTPRSRYQQVCNHLEIISRDSAKPFEITKIFPRDWTRIRLIGPRAREEALKLVDSRSDHDLAINDADIKLSTYNFGTTIGRYIESDAANFTYFKSKPQTVDIVFKKCAGRMLWHQLITNKAHLVGGYRDIARLLGNPILVGQEWKDDHEF